ncbi:MAG: iron-containing alcohol dehydrogenase [Raoultibacter sp.]
MTKSSFQFSVRQSFVICGVGAAAQAPGLLKKMGGTKCVLFTDAVLTKLGFTEKMQNYFDAEADGVELAGVFDTVEADARSTVINKASDYYRSIGGNCILTVGGGSVIDTAKAVLWMAENKVTDVHKVFSEKMKYIDMFPTAKPLKTPSVIIPTTAGTGSEVSTTAVIFNEEMDLKISIMQQYLGANCAILDAEFTETLPASMTASTGFDAMTHALEGFFSPKASVASDPYAKQAMKIIYSNLVESTTNGHNLEARENMLLGSVLGITAFGLTFGAMPIHNMSMTFGTLYHTPHALAVAVLMAPTMRALPDVYLDKICEFAENLGVSTAGTKHDCLDRCIEALDEFRSAVGLPEKFDINYDDINIDEFMTLVHTEGGGKRFFIPDEQVIEIMKAVTK